MTHHGMTGLNGLNHFCNYAKNQTLTSGRFGRIFTDLPPLYTDPDILRNLGAQNGSMDGGTGSSRTDTVPVGQVFFGQFIDHDITLDTSSSLERVNSEAETENVRTPTLDLDSLFGDGPEGSPFLYVQEGDFSGVKLLTGADGTAITQDAALRAADLVRSPGGSAVIGDPRNDENRIISQIHLGLINFHNRVVDTLASEYEGEELFEESHTLVIAHYHWAVLHDFLTDMCGSAVVWDILGNGRQFYCADEALPFIPIEFSVAAFRFGHSMAPQKIQVQTGDSAFSLFGDVLGRGFSPLSDERAIVDHNEIFNTAANQQVQMAETMDTKLATTLLNLPFINEGETSLATRNLLRAQSFLLPSGENIAATMDRPEAEVTQVSDFANNASGGVLNGKTPLWFYILAESEIIGRETRPGQFDKGEGLGPVGARLVAEVIIGLMELDSRSFLSTNRGWSPEDGLGASVRGIGDLLVF